MRWTLKEQPEQGTIEALAAELQVDTIIAKLLLQRGITCFDEAKHFFRPALEDLHKIIHINTRRAVQKIVE